MNTEAQGKGPEIDQKIQVDGEGQLIKADASVTTEPTTATAPLTPPSEARQATAEEHHRAMRAGGFRF